MQAATWLTTIFGLAFSLGGAGCSIESGKSGLPLEARESGGTRVVSEADHRYLELRSCPVGQALLATAGGWECGTVFGAGSGVAEVVAGDGVQVTPEGATRRVEVQYAENGDALGNATTVARSDHGHSELTDLRRDLDNKAEQTGAAASGAVEGAADPALDPLQLRPFGVVPLRPAGAREAWSCRKPPPTSGHVRKVRRKLPEISWNFPEIGSG